MAKDDNLGDYLTDIADAIREKKGTSEPINAQDFASEIASIEGGGGIAQRVTYLRRTNVGYIDTGVAGANSNIKIKIRYAMRVFPTGYWNLIYAYVNESTDATRILLNKNTYVLGSLNSIASNSCSVTRTGYVGMIYTDTIEPASSTSFTVIANGVSGTKTRTQGNKLEKNILIFPGGTDAVDVELYGCEIYDGDTLIRNFIPDYRNGEYGLYDTINKKFYGNDGGGAFSGEIITIDG